MIHADAYLRLRDELSGRGITLVAVSKTHPPDVVRELYELGHRVFGENRVQELLEKKAVLPDDIHWHLIGHLQTNKVKQAVGAVSMIEAVDSMKLLRMISNEAEKSRSQVDILLQLKIAREETKYGFDPRTIYQELSDADFRALGGIRYRGVMGMASFVDDMDQVRGEFRLLKHHFDTLREKLFHDHKDFDQISMGMSGDFRVAIEEGSTMVRIGSLIFGERLPHQ